MVHRIIIVNDRDRRTLQWLRDTVGEPQISAAIEGLAGQRQPYISNICKSLGVTPPSDLTATSKEKGRANMEEIRKMLKR